MPQSSSPQSVSARLRPAPTIARSGPSNGSSRSPSSNRPRTRPSHECHICKKTFTKRSNMLIHERLHTGEKPYVCSHGCGKRYSWLSSINFHETRCAARMRPDGGDGPNAPGGGEVPHQHRTSSSGHSRPGNGAGGGGGANVNASSGAASDKAAQRATAVRNTKKSAISASRNPNRGLGQGTTGPLKKSAGSTPKLSRTRQVRSRPSRPPQGGSPSLAASRKRGSTSSPPTLFTPKKPRARAVQPPSPSSVGSAMSDELDALLAAPGRLCPQPFCSYQQPHPYVNAGAGAPGCHHNNLGAPGAHQLQAQGHVGMPTHSSSPFFSADMLTEPLTPQPPTMMGSHPHADLSHTHGYHHGHPTLPTGSVAASGIAQHQQQMYPQGQTLQYTTSPVTPGLASHSSGGVLKSETLLDDFCLAGVDLFPSIGAEQGSSTDAFGGEFGLDTTELTIF